MKFVPSAVTRAVGNQRLLASKNAPSVLFGVGVVGSVASTVLACRATLKLDDVVTEAQMDLHTAKSINMPDRYSESDRRKDITLIYARQVGKVIRLYTPAALVGGASILCLTKSHNILQERNLALAAAYAAVDKAFEEYRVRVVEKYGEDQDREFRYATEEIEYTNPETGKVETQKVLSRDNDHSMYARFFDEYSPSWSKEPEYNLLFLRCQQNWANDLLKARGHVFLNEVYDMLGIGRSKAGAVVGWMISDDGDNFIDFGVFEADNEMARDFVNGREGSILLDFNVDGVIYDRITDHGERLSWQS